MTLTTRPLLLLALLLCYLQAGAKFSNRYTRERPLVIVCDWELPPYEFLDDHGEPAGYAVEVLATILDKLEVPHLFVLKENPLADDSLGRHNGQLFLAPGHLPHDRDCHLSSNVLYYYRMKLASRNDAPPISSAADIEPGKTLIFRLDGQIATSVLSKVDTKANVEYHAPMEALSGVSNGKYDYFVWGEEPLKWKIKELNLENIRINDLDIPATEIRIGSYDQELIDAIDDQYARFDQSGDISLLRDKWLHPERRHNNTSSTVLYIAVAAVVLLLLLFLLNRLVARNVKRMTRKNSEQTRLMNLALDMGGYMVAEYDPRKDRFNNLRGQLMAAQDTLDTAARTLHKDDLGAFNAKIEELRTNESTSSQLLVRRNDGSPLAPHWQYLTGSCIKERNEEGRTNYLLVAKDITHEMDEQNANNEAAAKYLKAFETAIIAMAFYDGDGRLLDLNDQMTEVIGRDAKNQQFFQQTRLFEAPLFRDIILPGTREVIHACQHMYYPEIGLNKYLEYRIRPVVNDEDAIRYYAVTVRDVTAERNLYREQLAIERQLKVTSTEANKFESQMNYLLKNTNMFIWRLDFPTRTIEVSRSLHTVESTFSLDSYMAGLAAEERDTAKETFTNPLLRNQDINIVRHFNASPMNGHEAWFAISGKPTTDRNGVVTGYFGIIRDITGFMRSQQELRRETAQAEQSGTMKAAFLANMTHEIRTPLNAIVGFSDLLHMTEAPEDRQEFIRIIRHNCDLLLRLVDDILETSNMTERPQQISSEDTDFAAFFDEVCQTVAQRVQAPGVTFIKDNPCDTLPTHIDRERVQQVITNFVTNAVKYTQQGHIRLGYKVTPAAGGDPAAAAIPTACNGDGLYIYCEDTGAGIPKEKQASVFGRFVKLNDYVQGTGLGLSICKSIAERCGGRIGVESEGQGKGSTFWLWIPRFLTSSNLTAEK